MKKEELIKQLQEKIADGMEVVIFDHRKNLHEDYGDDSGCSAGIYPNFDIIQFTNEEIKDGSVPFAVLMFDNDDYDDETGKNDADEYREVLEDHKRLVRELDVLLNGKNAAEQASLCDIVAQLRTERKNQ